MVDLLKYKQSVYDIIGAAYTVHNILKFGLLESVYAEALCLELASLGIAAAQEVELPVYYKDTLLNKKFRMDIVCGDIIIELKAVSEVLPEHRTQLYNYMRLARKPIGLLINFGEDHLHAERYVFDEETNRVSMFH